MKIIVKDDNGKTVIERNITKEEVTVSLRVKEGSYSMVQQRVEEECPQAYH